METVDIDNLDRCILHCLQGDARHVSANTIAERVDVSARTIRNRIDRLEETGVIRGYELDVDYETAGYQLHTMVICTAPIADRGQIARDALEVPGVIDVVEIMTGEQNLFVEVVGTDGDDLSRITRDLSGLGLEINDEDIIRNNYTTAFHQFDRCEQRAPDSDE
jgi:Lrp/AsnC family leucine-responsive transcriptional regulator